MGSSLSWACCYRWNLALSNLMGPVYLLRVSKQWVGQQGATNIALDLNVKVNFSAKKVPITIKSRSSSHLGSLQFLFYTKAFSNFLTNLTIKSTDNFNRVTVNLVALAIHSWKFRQSWSTNFSRKHAVAVRKLSKDFDPNRVVPSQL